MPINVHSYVGYPGAELELQHNAVLDSFFHAIGGPAVATQPSFQHNNSQNLNLSLIKDVES